MRTGIKNASTDIARLSANVSKILNKFPLTNSQKYRTVIKLGEKISIHSTNKELISRVKEANTFINPKYESNEKHGYSNWKTPSTIEIFQCNEDGSIFVPRGFFSQLLQLCNEYSIDPFIEDFRSVHPVSFPELNKITLRHYQLRAVEQVMLSDHGVIISPTGSGKSLIGLEIIRKRGQKALIIVHRGELAKQWLNVINDHMGLKAGFIGDGDWTIGDQITVAMVQTLAARENETRGLCNTFGLVIAEECQHLPCDQFSFSLSLLAAKYLYGLSATPNRRDGLEPIIYHAIGPAISTISKQEVEELGATVPATIFSIETGFNPGFIESWNEYLDSLTHNISRNQFIIDLAKKSEGGSLILVDRIEHAKKISEILDSRKIDHVLAHGQLKKIDRETVMNRIKSSKLTVGTYSLLGEGIDVSVWGTLIMGAPISSEIKLMQAIGRIVRPSIGKEKAIVYDLIDNCVFSKSSFKKRFEIYKKNKIWVEFK